MLLRNVGIESKLKRGSSYFDNEGLGYITERNIFSRPCLIKEIVREFFVVKGVFDTYISLNIERKII
jgi:hypothetical protein